MMVVFNLLMAIVTNIINTLLSAGIHMLTEMERPQSKTSKMGSLMIKNIIAKFLNTTVIYFIYHRMSHEPYMSNEGLVSNIIGLTGFSATLKIAMDLLQVDSYLMDYYYRWKYRKTTHINMFQLQLN